MVPPSKPSHPRTLTPQTLPTTRTDRDAETQRTTSSTTDTDTAVPLALTFGRQLFEFDATHLARLLVADPPRVVPQLLLQLFWYPALYEDVEFWVGLLGMNFGC